MPTAETPKTIREEQMPACPLMREAWYGSVHWALGEPSVLAQFRTETGNTWKPATDGLGAMIDTATGADAGFMSAFIDWHNATIWGDLSITAFSTVPGLSDEETASAARSFVEKSVKEAGHGE